MSVDALLAWYADLSFAVAERRSLQAARDLVEAELSELDDLPDVDLLWLATECAAEIQRRRKALQAELAALGD
jgi:hypothetical protein